MSDIFSFVFLKNNCPHCNQQGLYAYPHTPASDHPELTNYYVECNYCDWEDADSYPEEWLLKRYTKSETKFTNGSKA